MRLSDRQAWLQDLFAAGFCCRFRRKESDDRGLRLQLRDEKRRQAKMFRKGSFRCSRSFPETTEAIWQSRKGPKRKTRQGLEGIAACEVSHFERSRMTGCERVLGHVVQRQEKQKQNPLQSQLTPARVIPLTPGVNATAISPSPDAQSGYSHR